MTKNQCGSVGISPSVLELGEVLIGSCKIVEGPNMDIIKGFLFYFSTATRNVTMVSWQTIQYGPNQRYDVSVN